MAHGDPATAGCPSRPPPAHPLAWHRMNGVGRCDPRQCRAEGASRKNVVTPAGTRQAVAHVPTAPDLDRFGLFPGGHGAHPGRVGDQEGPVVAASRREVLAGCGHGHGGAAGAEAGPGDPDRVVFRGRWRARHQARSRRRPGQAMAGQPFQPFGVADVNPIPQPLPVGPATPGGSFALCPLRHRCDRRHAPHHSGRYGKC